MLQKNQYFEGECIDYTYDGMGIVKVDGVPYFVKDMLVHEVGELKVIKVLKTYGIARLIKLHRPSKERVKPICPLFKACGGCHLQHFSVAEQRRFKTKYVKDCLTRIAHIDDVEVANCHMMAEGIIIVIKCNYLAELKTVIWLQAFIVVIPTRLLRMMSALFKIKERMF